MKNHLFIFLVFILPIFFLASCSSKKASTIIENSQFINYGKRGQYLYITLQKQQSVNNLSQEYKVPIRVIKDLNLLQDYNHIQTGTVIKVPIIKYHFIKHDENLESIARMYNIDLHSLIKQNNISLSAVIHTGRYIKIPEFTNHFIKINNLRTTNCKDFINKNTCINRSIQKTKQYPKIITTKNNSNKIYQYLSNGDFINNKYPANLKNFEWPVTGKVIKKYGHINGQFNEGINIVATEGTAVRAASYGHVIYNGYQLKHGNLIILKHDNGYMTAYSHLEKSLIKKGQIVTKGLQIGTVGKSGNVNKPQIQFAMKKGMNTINPDR